MKGKANIVVAETKLVHSQLEADYWYARWKDEGYEGGMYRDYNAPYGFEHNCGNKENRWWSIQKRKDFLDMKAKIVDIYEGEGGFAGMLGGFVCELDNGVTCNVGGGLTIDQRQLYWEFPERVIGGMIDINYEMFSDGGQPLKATIECVYET
jgi:ATP-dependent DNA ligase